MAVSARCQAMKASIAQKLSNGLKRPPAGRAEVLFDALMKLGDAKCVVGCDTLSSEPCGRRVGTAIVTVGWRRERAWRPSSLPPGSTKSI